MQKSKPRHTCIRSLLLCAVCSSALWGCQRFSLFECLNSEEGCNSIDEQPSDMAVDGESPRPDRSVADAGPRDMSLNDMSPNDMSPNDMSPNDMSLSDMLPNDMSPNDMSSNDMSLDCQVADPCDEMNADCGGDNDEGAPPILERIHLSELTQLDSECVHSKLTRETCQVTANRYCGALPCYSHGVGPLRVGNSLTPPGMGGDEDSDVWLLCLPQGSVTEYTLTYSELTQLPSECDRSDDVHKSKCRYAFQRHCQASLSQSGFGLISFNNAQVTFGCVEAVELITTYDELRMHVNGCDGDREKDTMSCKKAILEHCVSEGFVGGWGPLARDRDDLTIACVPSVADSK